MSYNDTSEQQRKMNKFLRNEHIEMMDFTNDFLKAIYIMIGIFTFMFSTMNLAFFNNIIYSYIAGALIGGSTYLVLMSMWGVHNRKKQNMHIAETKAKERENQINGI